MTIVHGDDRVDAVVIGAGPNGLVAANMLVDAGWRVLLLEAQATVGGAVRSDRSVDPDFVHDTCSSGARLCGGCKGEAITLLMGFLKEHKEKRDEKLHLVEGIVAKD